VFNANIILAITILVAFVLIWWWPAIRVALRLPTPKLKVMTDGEVGLAQLALGRPWRQTPVPHARAALQVCDQMRSRYVAVFSESLADFERDVTLRQYSEGALGRWLESFDVLTVTGPVDCTVASMAAEQHEYSIRYRGQRFTYVHTTVEGRRAFHQVIGWSSSSNFDRRAFQQALEGFGERPGPVPERPEGDRTQMRPPGASSAYTVH
jgi:hypothetical protein